MSPTNMTASTIALHVYTDFDSTVVLTDTGNSILAHQMGHKELDRIDRLPETEPGRVSLRKAEDMKWEHLRLSVKEAADILVSSEDNILLQQNGVSTGATNGTTTDGFNKVPFDDRQQYSGDTAEEVEALNDKYRVRLDPGFRQFHAFCQEHEIPMTVVSIGIQPLIEEMLDRYLGVNHKIIVRANGLTIRPDGTWRILWRDSSPYGVEKGRALREARANDLQNPKTDKILWCGDGSSDFPAALHSDIVLARQNTSLEKLCRANSIPHRSFVTFATVQEMAQEWLDQQHEKSRQQQEDSKTMSSASTNGSGGGGGVVEP